MKRYMLTVVILIFSTVLFGNEKLKNNNYQISKKDIQDLFLVVKKQFDLENSNYLVGKVIETTEWITHGITYTAHLVKFRDKDESSDSYSAASYPTFLAVLSHDLKSIKKWHIIMLEDGYGGRTSVTFNVKHGYKCLKIDCSNGIPFEGTASMLPIMYEVGHRGFVSESIKIFILDKQDLVEVLKENILNDPSGMSVEPTTITTSVLYPELMIGKHTKIVVKTIESLSGNNDQDTKVIKTEKTLLFNGAEY